jgi:predicted AAA+ superfamily ATPase
MDAVVFLKEEKFLMEEMLAKMVKQEKRDAFKKLDKSKLIIIYGLRGTGKTTLLAQKYFESEKKLAIHGEHLSIAGYKIKDLIQSMKYIITDGYLFIDEITKLKNWAEELKVLSDMYPNLRIIVTGSSAVDLQNARRVLARRALFINLKPLTFNEFLRIKYKISITQFDPFSKDPLTEALKTELDAREKISDIGNVVKEYKVMNLPYLIEGSTSSLLDVLERIIYQDIGGSYSFSEETLDKFKPLLKLLALSEKISYDSISRDIGVGKGTVIKMLDLLSKANVIRAVYPYATGKGTIRKEPKYLFTSPTIRETLLSFLGEKERAVGLTREDLFAMHIDELFYLKTGPDYVWRDTLFEIGGERKTTEQFKEIKIIKKMRKYIIHEGLQTTSNEIIRLPFYIFLSHF